MPRSVNAVAKRARRKKVLKQAKGYFGRRKNVWTVAKNAVDKAMLYAYRDRKTNKRNFRALWITRINAAARLHGLSYSQFIGKVKANEIELRKIARGKYFRVVAEIWADGRNVNELMIEKDYAIAYDGGTKEHSWCTPQKETFSWMEFIKSILSWIFQQVRKWF